MPSLKRLLVPVLQGDVNLFVFLRVDVLPQGAEKNIQ